MLNLSVMRGVSIAALVAVAMVAYALAEPPKQPAAAGNGPPRSAAPGPVQLEMAKRAGQWTLAKKLSMPGQQPMTASGSATITSILGGRFLREENSGTLFGQPVAAEMISGYNDETDKYEVVWGWTGANRLISASGTSTDGGKTIHYTSAYDNGKGKHEQLVIDLRIVNDDCFVVSLVSKLPDGSDGPAVETTYTRQK